MKKEILITGCGSLGETFIRLLHKKYDLTVVDNCEWTVARLQKEFPTVKFMLEDYSEWKYDQDPVDYIIHTAAYKHLPLGEENPNAFIDNNIIKLRKLFAEAYKNNVDLLFVSTDKAVEPCSLYGYTKAIGESLARYYNFSITRCGNLLNSSGSVIPVWEDCIKRGVPIPITDGRCVRYFIEIDEAARQMWDWFYLGDKLIIPQCEKISIIDLADKTYERHGTPKDKRKIEFIGLRDKEKLSEKLRWDFEEGQL